MIPDTLLSNLRRPGSRHLSRSLMRSASTPSWSILSSSNLISRIGVVQSRPAKDIPFLLRRGSSRRCSSWMELEDDLLILLHGNLASLEEFRRILFDDYGRTALPSEILLCLACLVCPDGLRSSTFYSFSVTTLASFLVNPRVGDEVKLACLRTVLSLRCADDPTTTWQLRDSAIEENLRFIVDSEESLFVKHHSEQVLLWELRAICQYQLSTSNRSKQNVTKRSRRRTNADHHTDDADDGSTTGRGMTKSAQLFMSGIKESARASFERPRSRGVE